MTTLTIDTIIQNARHKALNPTQVAKEKLTALSNNVEVIQSTAQNIFNATTNHLFSVFNSNPSLHPSIKSPLVLNFLLDTRATSSNKCYQTYLHKVGEICWPNTLQQILRADGAEWCHKEKANNELKNLNAVEIHSEANYHFLNMVGAQLIPLLQNTAPADSSIQFRVQIQPYNVRKIDSQGFFSKIRGAELIQSLQLFIFEKPANQMSTPSPQVTTQPLLNWDNEDIYTRLTGTVTGTEGLNKTYISLGNSFIWEAPHYTQK